MANETFPAEFIRENLLLQTHIIDAAHRFEVKKLVFLGSNCIYPRECAQPVKEGYLMTGPLEPTNSAYAVAKIAGVEMCQAYRRQYGFNTVSAMPCNLYGPHDNFNLIVSHAMPGLIRKFHEAKAAGASQVVLWGTGRPRREFLHADDMATAAVFLMQTDSDGGLFNVGTGEEHHDQGGGNPGLGSVQYEGEVVFAPRAGWHAAKGPGRDAAPGPGLAPADHVRDGLRPPTRGFSGALADPSLAIGSSPGCGIVAYLPERGARPLRRC